MESKNESSVISLDAVDLNLLPISETHRDGGAVPLWRKSNLDSRRKEYYEFVIKSDDAKDYRMESTNDVYVISLDAVDLNLLPISQTHRDGGAVPLWRKSNLDSRRKEYYEFVIKSDDTKEVIENVTCHICDINVPKGYFNEHKNGFRHKFNRKVADTALKRLQLYVNKKNVNEFINEKHPFKHFCTECSIVIDSEDETSHKQTTGHRNALFLERFLNDFLNFYTNDDNKIDDTRKCIKTELMKESKNLEQNFVSDEVNVIETVLANIKKESIKKEDVIETKGTLNSDELNNNIHPSSDLQDEYVLLDVVDGLNINKFKVTEMCYDAIVVTGATSEYCMICNEMFVRENRLLHVDGKIHDQNLRQKSLDKNCVRKINSTHHHCVLCNDYFTEYDLHVNSMEHLTNYRNKIIYKCKKTVQDNDNSNKDKKNDNAAKYSDVINSDENKSSTGVNKDIAPVNKRTSDSLVPSTSSSVAKNETLENSNKTVQLAPISYFCEVCQVKFPNTEKNIEIHNKGRSHVKNLHKTKAGNNTVEVTNSYFCKVCQVKVVNNLNNIAEHNRGEPHMKKLRETKDVNNTNVEPINSYFCEVCQVKVPNNPNNIAEHNKGGSHKQKLQETKAVNNTKVEPIHSYEYFCEVCQVKVTNNPNNIEQHNRGGLHKQKLQETKAVNNTKVEPIHSYQYFCEVCQVKVPNTEKNIAIHNKGRPHLKNLQDTKDVNNTEVEAISNKKSNLHYQMKESERLNYVTCIVCNTYLTNNDRNIFTHIEGENHKSNYNEFCARNLLVLRGNLLYCNACEVIPGLRNEFAHCNGRNHKFNLEEVVSN